MVKYFSYLSIESHFVGVHRPYELHRCIQFAFLSDAIHMACEHQKNAIQYLYLHLFTTKFVVVLLTLTQKCHTGKTLRTASTGRMTNWKKPLCDPVQIIRTKDWYFKSLIIVNTVTSYFFTNLHVIYFWNGHRERRSSHWHLQLHTRSAERYRWRCADLHSDAIMLSLIHSGLQHI